MGAKTKSPKVTITNRLFKNLKPYQLVGIFSSSNAILDVKNIVGGPNTKYQ
jgi:hypothetical protein